MRAALQREAKSAPDDRGTTPFRVAYVVARYPAVSQTFVLDEVLALRSRGVEVQTFSIRRPPREEVLAAADREAASTTVNVLPPRLGRLAIAHLRALLTRPGRYLEALAFALRMGRWDARRILWQLFYFGEAMLIWDVCRRRGIRHVHAHFANVATDVAMIAARYGGATWSWSFTLHGPVEFADVRGHRLAEKIQDATLVVCISDFARSQAMQLCPPVCWEKLALVRVGIDVEQFAPTGIGVPADGSLRVLTVGRLSARKGHSVLIESVARAAGDVRLVIVGDGEERPALERLAASLEVAHRIDFAGAVGRDDIRPFFAAADVFCLPSFAEGLPVVLMEAMAMELPVVATWIAGVPELVEDGVHGHLVPPGRADAVADALGALATARAALPTMGRAGRAKVLSQHDVRRTAAELERRLREAAA
jgi:colanic acid/amylovoran biosynthesis glycosyltransferase